VYAALVTGQSRVEIIEVADPTPAVDGVVVDIALCGICGTDVHAYQTGRPYNPAICGHEWVGVVSARGRDVRTVAEGERVVISVPSPCGHCSPCSSGDALHCVFVFAAATGRSPADASAQHGGFALRLAVNAGRVIACPASLSDVEAAQVEPATVVVHGVSGSHLRAGDVAVVQGAGPIGLLTVQVARAAGARDVFVIEPDPFRQSIALATGASLAMAPDGDTDEIIRSHTNGLGADIVFECVGHGFAIQKAVDLTRRGGSVCLLGYPDGEATITPSTWLRKEIRLTAGLGFVRSDFEQTLELVTSGQLQLHPLHTGTIGLQQLPETMSTLASGNSGHIKVLVDPRL
jgi:(R,R)-butanediol dehydrogenase / meso-butanediol dehydrogenase / diacetyl reductase